MTKELESYKQPAHKFKTTNGQIEKAIKTRRLFALEYMGNGGDGKTAAIKAGYSPKTAHVAASRLLKDARVQKFMKSHSDKVEKAAGASYEWKVQKLLETVEMCMQGKEDKDGLFKHQGVVAAIAELNKMAGDYAPTKTESKNVNVNAEIDDVRRIMDEYKRDY